MNEFEGILGFDTQTAYTLATTSVDNILNTIYENVKNYPNNMELNVGVIFLVITAVSISTIQKIFKLIDCSKINSDVAVGLLRASYIYKENYILEDFNRVLNYFKNDPIKFENLFHGLDS